MSIRTRLAALNGRLIPEHKGLGCPHLSREELEAEVARLRGQGRSILVAKDALPGFPQIIELVDGGLLPNH